MSAAPPGPRAGTLIVRAGRIVYASEGVAAVVGRPVEEIVGRPFEEFLAPGERAPLLERYARRLGGEPVPDRYDTSLALGDSRRAVELHVEQDGADVLVHVRDASAQAQRRLRLDAVAALGAAIQSEHTEEAIHARVREGLRSLGLSCALFRAEPDGVRVAWASVVDELPRGFRAVAGTDLDGYLARWSELARRIWTEGSVFTDDWALEASRLVPDPLASPVRQLVGASGIARAVAVRLDQRDGAEGFLVVAGDWLRSDDTPALRLFGAQIAAALDAARTIADLSRRNADLAALNRVAELASDARDLDAFFARAAEVLRASAGCAGLAVFVGAPDSGELARAYADGLPAELPARLALAGAPGRAAEQRVAQVVERGEGGEPTLGFETVAWIPLVVRARAVGVLACGYRTGAAAVRARVGLLSSVAPHLAAALEAGQLLSDLRRRVDELTTVLDVARVVSSSLDLEQVLGAGAEHLKETLGADGCSILLDDPRGRDLRRAASRGEPVGPERVPVDVRSLPRDALDGGAPVTGRCPGGANPGATVLAVPLHVRSEPLGVALVRGSSPGRVFTAGELTRATAIASQLAIAVDNARLYSETLRRAEELALLHEVGRSLVATLDIARILDAGVRNIARIVDAPDAYLAFPTDDGATLRIAAVAGAHPEHVGRLLPLDPPDGNLPSVVFNRREPIVIEDGLVDPRINQALRSQTGGRGYLGLPLVVRDRTIGALLIIDPRGPRLFTPAEVERAAGIANQLAVAVENARLYEDLRRSYAELERTQRQLVQRERLAALGELSAVVAHEVRNPLGVIFNSLGSLRRLVRPTGDARVLLDIVDEEAERLNRIVGDLLDFARPSTAELRPERLAVLVEEAIGAALAQRPAGVEVARDLDERLPPVALDARLARQAVVNVAVNAVQAMPRGGRLTVRTRREGEAAVLEIEDTGVGMPAEVQERIFEPFFTTKASGTGLGLAVVKRIVEEHGGAVAVRSAPGAGTVFALRFPLAGPPVEKGPAIG